MSGPAELRLARASTVPEVMPTVKHDSERSVANGQQDAPPLTRAARVRMSLQKSATGAFSSTSTLVGGRSMSDPAAD